MSQNAGGVNAMSRHVKHISEDGSDVQEMSRNCRNNVGQMTRLEMKSLEHVNKKRKNYDGAHSVSRNKENMSEKCRRPKAGVLKMSKSWKQMSAPHTRCPQNVKTGSTTCQRFKRSALKMPTNVERMSEANMKCVEHAQTQE